MNYCMDGGYLVGDEYPVPDDPTEYYGYGLSREVGCNQLWCQRCGVPVRQAVGVLASKEATAETIHASPDWAAIPNLVIPRDPQSGRLYACRCQLWGEHFTRALFG
jgi:hypothetical protein